MNLTEYYYKLIEESKNPYGFILWGLEYVNNNTIKIIPLYDVNKYNESIHYIPTEFESTLFDYELVRFIENENGKMPIVKKARKLLAEKLENKYFNKKT